MGLIDRVKAEELTPQQAFEELPDDAKRSKNGKFLSRAARKLNRMITKKRKISTSD